MNRKRKHAHTVLLLKNAMDLLLERVSHLLSCTIHLNSRTVFGNRRQFFFYGAALKAQRCWPLQRRRCAIVIRRTAVPFWQL